VFKNWKLYRLYKKAVREMEPDLEKNFRLERDYVYRLYTVINLDPKIVNQYYPEDISATAINDYVTKVDRYMMAKGLSELIALREVTKLDNFNIKIVFGFNKFDSAKRANRIFFLSALALIATIVATIVIF